MVRIYETVLILKPTMSDPEVAEVAEKTKQMIASGGGEVISQEVWGRRKLTHIIGKARDGVYVYFKYKSTPALLGKLGHNFRVSDLVLRHSFALIQERKVKEKKPRKPKAAAAA